VYLAQQIGAELVEGRDLVVTDDDELCVRNVNGLQRIDVLYRRVDDAFIDPDVFVEDSMLGVRGLMRAWKAGRVAIANAPGAGVADDKVVYSFVPDIIEYYLNEKPQLANVETYRCADPEHRDYVLNHLDELVVKPANESGGYGLLIGPHATPEEREATAQSIRDEPRNWIAQPTLAISTAPTLTDNGIAARHVDLRPFVLQGETLAVSTGGLTRVALREGSLVVNSSQGGGSKDTWIVDLDEGTASSGSDHEQLDSSQSQSQTTRPTLGALPPLPPESRLLARNAENLYWLGRYLERAECTARFIDTHARLMMDVGNDRRGIGWTSLITITGNEEAFEKTGAVNNEAGICHFLIGEPENPGSLLNIAIAMHENLRSTREFLPSSVYESFSALCRSVRAGAPHSAQAPQRTRFLADIEQRLLALAGSIDGSLSRGTGWLAMRMGVHLERADMTSRVLDVRSQMLINDEHSLAPTITEREWMSVLSSLMALRMYRLHVNRPIDGGEVLRYLLDDPDLPRAWRYCVDRLRACVRQLGRAEVPNAALDALMQKIDSADLSALAADRVAPAPHTRTPIISYSLDIKPAGHFINWQQDPFGNWLARLIFPEPVTELSVAVDLVCELTVINPFDFFVEDYAENFPFTYSDELKRELAPYLDVTPPGPLLEAWLKQHKPVNQNINDALVSINQAVQSDIDYRVRLEPGVQTSEDTLSLASGSCRDSGWLLVEIMRHYGLAARFVSGYLVQLVPDIKAVDGPTGPEADFTDLHAWTEVYLPGAGWVGLDPTSGLFAGEGHIPLACTPLPSSAAPISGGASAPATQFDFHNRVSRFEERPRVTHPYTDATWNQVLALGEAVDNRLDSAGLTLTMGGEPTFVSSVDFDAPEWNEAALGEHKLERATALHAELLKAFAPKGVPSFAQGKWYPGEPTPRWALVCHWRDDDQPLLEHGDAIALPGDSLPPADENDARRLMDALIDTLGVASDGCRALHEDPLHSLHLESLLPEADSLTDLNLDDSRSRRLLVEKLERGLDRPVGWMLPLEHDADRWQSGVWPQRRSEVFLVPGDSPAGLRLPLDSLPEDEDSDAEARAMEEDTFEPATPLPDAGAKPTQDCDRCWRAMSHRTTCASSLFASHPILV